MDETLSTCRKRQKIENGGNGVLVYIKNSPKNWKKHSYESV